MGKALGLSIRQAMAVARTTEAAKDVKDTDAEVAKDAKDTDADMEA